MTQSGPPRRTRRAVLATAGAVVAGTAGCLSRASPVGTGTDGAGRSAVSILAAGSLHNALENGLRAAVDRPVRVEAHGSVQVARLVAEGLRDPDIVSVADVALFDGPLHPGWFARFATNSIVLAYNPDTPGGRRLQTADRDRWFRPLLEGDVTLGRTDPDLDPLGYRTLFALDLASEYYGTAVDLRDSIPAAEQLYPETQLVSQFETGSIEAAFAYRSMAMDRDFAFIDLPAAIDLSDPGREEAYAETTYELPTGRTVRGAPISYGTTARTESEAVSRVFRMHSTGEYLTRFGLTVPESYPEFVGNVPEDFLD